LKYNYDYHQVDFDLVTIYQTALEHLFGNTFDDATVDATVDALPFEKREIERYRKRERPSVWASNKLSFAFFRGVGTPTDCATLAVIVVVAVAVVVVVVVGVFQFPNTAAIFVCSKQFHGLDLTSLPPPSPSPPPTSLFGNVSCIVLCWPDSHASAPPPSSAFVQVVVSPTLCLCRRKSRQAIDEHVKCRARDGNSFLERNFLYFFWEGETDTSQEGGYWHISKSLLCLCVCVGECVCLYVCVSACAGLEVNYLWQGFVQVAVR